MSDADEQPAPSRRRAPRGATALFDRIHMQGMLGALKKVSATKAKEENALSWFAPWLPEPPAPKPPTA